MRSGPEVVAPLADSLSAPNSSPELVKESPSALERVVLSRRFLKALTACADELLYKLSSGTSELNRELIEAVERFKHSFPQPDDMDRLFSFTESADKQVRRGAAHAIFQLGSVLVHRSELREVLTNRLLNVLDSHDLDPEVRLTILPAVAWFANSNDSNCEIAFERTLCALGDADERIRYGSLLVLQEFGVDRVSAAVCKVIDALNDSNPWVRIAACGVLGWLSEDANEAITELVNLAASDCSIEERVAAGAALVRIDPDGKQINIAPDHQKRRDSLLAALRHVGELARPLRRSLEKKWNESESRGRNLPSSRQSTDTGQARRSQKNERTISKFPNPGGLRWEEVKIEFVSNDSIKVTGRGVSKRYLFVEIGFRDGRRGDRPIPLWSTFQKLAEQDGAIKWNLWRATTSRATSKAMSRIRKLLQEFMGIEDDPFRPYEERKSYVTKFELRDCSFGSAADREDLE